MLSDVNAQSHQCQLTLLPHSYNPVLLLHMVTHKLLPPPQIVNYLNTHISHFVTDYATYSTLRKHCRPEIVT